MTIDAQTVHITPAEVRDMVALRFIDERLDEVVGLFGIPEYFDRLAAMRKLLVLVMEAYDAVYPEPPGD